MRKYKMLPTSKNNLPEGDSPQCICSRCRSLFSDFHHRCPECGSYEWESYQEENPYSRMPLERFIQLCGHGFWLVGTILFIAFLWQTDSNDYEQNKLYIYMAIFSLIAGVLISAFYFALGELIVRTMRIQRRLRAFHDHYRQRYPSLSLIKKDTNRRLKKVRTKAKKSISIEYLTRIKVTKKD